MPAGLCDKLIRVRHPVQPHWDMLDFSCREYNHGDVVRKMDEAGAIQLTTVVRRKHLAWSDCLDDAGAPTTRAAVRTAPRRLRNTISCPTSTTP